MHVHICAFWLVCLQGFFLPTNMRGFRFRCANCIITGGILVKKPFLLVENSRHECRGGMLRKIRYYPVPRIHKQRFKNLPGRFIRQTAKKIGRPVITHEARTVSHALHRPPVASRPLERRSLRRPEQTQNSRCIRSLQAAGQPPACQLPKRQRRNVNQGPKVARHGRRDVSPIPPTSAGQGERSALQETSKAPRAGRPLPAMKPPDAPLMRHFPAPHRVLAGWPRALPRSMQVLQDQNQSASCPPACASNHF